MNGINLEEVRQAKAKWIMTQLSSSRNNEILSDEKHKSALELEFEAILQELTDLEFMVLCCLNATHSNLKMTRDLLIKAQCSKIGKKCNFKSAKKHYLSFQKWQKKSIFAPEKSLKLHFL